MRWLCFGSRRVFNWLLRLRISLVAAVGRPKKLAVAPSSLCGVTGATSCSDVVAAQRGAFAAAACSMAGR